MVNQYDNSFFIIMTIAVDKVDGDGPSNTTCCAHLAKYMKLTLY